MDIPIIAVVASSGQARHSEAASCLLVVVDELWLDWTVLFPTLPAFLANGLLPLALTLLGLAAIYAGLRWLLRTNHSEAFVGLFSFIMASLVMLTVIGVYFRGENMVLLWPW